MADQITLKRIREGAHPALRAKMEKDYLDCNRTVLGKGVRLRFTSVLRTFDQQADIYAKGRTLPGSIVSNAEPGQSYHNYGLAFDIVLLYDNDGNGTFEEASWDDLRDGDNDRTPDWMEVVAFMKSRDWVWGGDFKSFSDKPHFQFTFGLHWKQLINRPRYPHIDEKV